MDRPYRGRFAPSPTGPLHLGSLLVAAASYLQARAHGGHWLLRLEDVDTVRCRPHWAERILRDLERLGMEWDGPVWRQSRRSEAYQAALARLDRAGLVYPCACSRKQIRERGRAGPLGWVYGGHCRTAGLDDAPGRALRLRVPEGTMTVHDPVQGSLCQDLAAEVGDFVLRRADGLYAYQLAVVVDDGAQGVSEVVRGADLWDNTPRQRYLARCLGLTPPATLHLPLLVDERGRKLSKSAGAAALDLERPGRALVRVLDLLGQEPPAELQAAPPRTIWEWALAHWDPARIPRRRTLSLETSLNPGATTPGSTSASPGGSRG